MKPPHKLLEGADLVAYVVVPESATFTGRLNLYVGGKRLGHPKGAAKMGASSDRRQHLPADHAFLKVVDAVLEAIATAFVRLYLRYAGRLNDDVSGTRR